MAAFVDIAQGVGNEVGQHPDDFFDIGADQGQSRGVVDGQGDAFDARLGAEDIVHLGEQGGHGHRFELQFDAAALDLRQVEQIVDQPLHALHLVVGGLQQVSFPFRQVVAGVFEEQVDTHAEAGQRGAQLMGGGHDEFTLQAFHLAQAGNVAQQQHDSRELSWRLADGGGREEVLAGVFTLAEREDAPVVGQVRLHAAGRRFGDDVADPGGGEQIAAEEGIAFLEVDAENTAAGGVDAGDPALGVEDHQAVFDGGEDGLALVVFGDDAVDVHQVVAAQFPRHAVELRRQLAQFVAGLDLQLDMELSGGNGLGRLDQAAQGQDEALGEDEAEEEGDHGGEQRHRGLGVDDPLGFLAGLFAGGVHGPLVHGAQGQATLLDLGRVGEDGFLVVFRGQGLFLPRRGQLHEARAVVVILGLDGGDGLPLARHGDALPGSVEPLEKEGVALGEAGPATVSFAHQQQQHADILAGQGVEHLLYRVDAAVVVAQHDVGGLAEGPEIDHRPGDHRAHQRDGDGIAHENFLFEAHSDLQRCRGNAPRGAVLPRVMATFMPDLT